jgi:hypothetical protein
MEGEAFAEELQGPLIAEAPLASFAGLDAGSFPGDAAMRAYRDMGFAVTGLYLSHGPARTGDHAAHDWIAAATGLVRAGWGVAPIYVGAEPAGSSSVPPPANPLDDARTDANEAIVLAQKAGFGPGDVLFLDVESAFSPNTPYESYVLKWLEVVKAGGFGTALYCFPKQIGWTKSNNIPIWTVHLNSLTGKRDPHTGRITFSNLIAPLSPDPIDDGAVGTQGRFYCHAAGLDIELDYDRWRVANPSRPGN